MKRVVALCLSLCAFVALASPGYAVAKPDATMTPGSVNAAVTQATIQQTICTVGYTRTIRQVSTATKHAVYVAYGIPKSQQSKYVIDHLVPLEVGGSNAKANLWPEPKSDATVKDSAENALHDRVCSGGIDLITAQYAFVTDWSTAVATATTTTTTTTTTTRPPVTQPPATQAPAPPATLAPTTPGNGATAQCNDGTYSYAANHQGACSSHGGVAVFYK